MADHDMRTQAARARGVSQKKVRHERRLKDGLERAQKMAAQHGGVCLSKEYRTVTTVMQWRCVNGHEFFTRYVNVYSGQWCPRCRVWRREEMCRLILEHLYELPFPSSWPEWLIGRNGRRISFDGYNHSLSIAFEHHGQQHYHYHGLFHKYNDDLNVRRELDARRVQQCKHNNVLLLEIPYWVAQEDLPNWIAEKLVELGAPPFKNKPLIHYPVNVFSSKRLQELMDAAYSRGGELLETEYKGANEKHRFRCGQGHEWGALPTNIKRGGWCRKCWRIELSKVQVRADGYERAKSFAESKGGELFIISYDGWNTPCLVRCARGHEWNTIVGELIRGDWCQKCAGIARRITIEQIQEIARQKGGVCLSHEYTGRNDKAKWRCANGHEWEAVFNSIMHGYWCLECVRKSRALTIQDMRQTAQERGGDCLSEVYINNHTKLLWKCSVGHEWMAKPNYIRGGGWCPGCYNLRRSRNFGRECGR